MSKLAKNYILLAVVLIGGVVVGFLLGKGLNKSQTLTLNNSTDSKPQQISLYTTQTATIQGKITGVEGNILSVQNRNNSNGKVKTTERLMVVPLPGTSSKPASPSSDLKQLELNKDVLITLELQNGEYVATLVQFIPPMPAVPSQPAAPKTPAPSAASSPTP